MSRIPDLADTAVLDSEDLADLAEWLHREGFRVSTQQAVLAQQLLLRLGAEGLLPESAERVASYLRPIFSGSPDDQRRFTDVFTLWWQVRTGRVVNIQPDEEEEKITPVAPINWWRRIVWSAAAVIAMIFALWLWWNFSFHTIAGTVTDSAGGALARAELSAGPARTTTDATGRYVLSVRRFDGPVDLTATAPGYIVRTERVLSLPKTIDVVLKRAPEGQSKLNREEVVRLPGKESTGYELITTVAVPPPSRFTMRSARWGAAALGAFGLVFAFQLIRQRMRQPVLERRLSRALRQVRELRAHFGARQILPRLGARDAARELRRKRVVQSRDLEPTATLAASLRNGGLFTPVFLSRSEPDYLLLIDRVSLQDHQAGLADLVAETFYEANVSLERWYFDREPRVCHRKTDTGRGQPADVCDLLELRGRFPEHRLLVFTDTAAFFDPFTGQPKAWIATLQEWRDTAVLTVVESSRWGRGEQVLSELGLMVLPFSQDGFSALVGIFAGRPIEQPSSSGNRANGADLIFRAPHRWLSRDAPSTIVEDRLCDVLRHYLGADGFAWLAACAVYPEIHWGMTLRLGKVVVLDSVRFEQALPRLSRLPWLRHAFMPDWFRNALLARLDHEKGETVRSTLHVLLMEDMPKTWDVFSLKISLDRLKWLRRWRERRWLRQGAENSPEDSPLRDHVFLRYMGRSRTTQLQTAAPSGMERILFRQGVRWFGLRRAVWLGAGLAAVGLGIQLASTRERAHEFHATLDTTGTLLATHGDDYSVHIWKVPSGERVTTLRGHTRPIYDAEFSLDGRLLTASADRTARIWNVATSRQIGPALENSQPVHEAGFIPGSSRVLTRAGLGKSAIAQIWEPGNTSPLTSLLIPGESTLAVGFSEDATYFATVDDAGSLRLWKTGGGFLPEEPIQKVGELAGTDAPELVSAQFSAHARRIAGVDAIGRVRVWDVPSLQPILTTVEVNGISRTTLAFSPDETRLAVVDGKRTLYAWLLGDTPEPREESSGEHPEQRVSATPLEHGVRSLEFTADGLDVLVVADKTAEIRNMRTGAMSARIEILDSTIDFAKVSASRAQVVATTKQSLVGVWERRHSVGTTALLVGCDYGASLSSPPEEVRAIGTELNVGYGIACTVMTNPTGGRFRDELQRARTTVRALDTFILMMAGHGFDKALDPKTSRPGYYFLFSTTEPDQVSLDELLDTLQEMPCRQVLLVLDTAFPATALGRRIKTQPGIPLISVIVSATDDPARDGSEGAFSPFAEAFLDTIQRAGEPMTGRVLASKIKRQMSGGTGTQTPGYAIVSAPTSEDDFEFPRRITAPANIESTLAQISPATPPETQVPEPSGGSLSDKTAQESSPKKMDINGVVGLSVGGSARIQMGPRGSESEAELLSQGLIKDKATPVELPQTTISVWFNTERQEKRSAKLEFRGYDETIRQTISPRGSGWKIDPSSIALKKIAGEASEEAVLEENGSSGFTVSMAVRNFRRSIIRYAAWGTVDATWIEIMVESSQVYVPFSAGENPTVVIEVPAATMSFSGQITEPSGRSLTFSDNSTPPGYTILRKGNTLHVSYDPQVTSSRPTAN